MLVVLSIHPIRVAQGFEKACDLAVAHLEKIADEVAWTPEDTSPLFLTAKTTLSSKIVSRCHDSMAQIAVDAVLSVADLERKVPVKENNVKNKCYKLLSSSLGLH